MTIRPDDDDSIWKLTDAVLNGTISESEFQQLESRLKSDPVARRLYLDYCELHGGLLFAIQSNQATNDAFSQLKLASITNRDDPATTKSAGEDKTNKQARVRLPGLLTSPVPSSSMWAMATTAIVLLAILHFAGMLHLPEPKVVVNQLEARPNRALPAGTTDHELAATLTGLIDCKWENEESAPRYGEPLYRNRSIGLKSGLAQITYESGAKLIVQGPADFTVNSAMEGRLDFGKVTAVVPKSAHGFTVRSPQATIVDLGTEFGIDFAKSGRTEVHVFSGEVVSWDSGKAASRDSDSIHVLKSESVTFDAKTKTRSVDSMNASKFVRKFTPRLSDDERPELPVSKKLALWLAADTLVQTDENQRVIAWQDILVGDNQTEEDAWQFDKTNRPRYVEQSIGDKPAIRFNGKSSYLVTTPMTTTDDQTVFIVYKQNQGAFDRKIGGQLLNYNGPPHRYIMPWGSTGVLQIGDLITTNPETKNIGYFRGHVFAGWKGKRAINVGSIYAKEELPVEMPTVCTYQYSPSLGRSELLMNGKSQGIATAPTEIAVTSRKVIGRHAAQDLFFMGDIAEILIYNDALSSEKINQVHSYLGKKYQIAIQSSQNN